MRICPQGFYRENWVDFDAANGTLCLPCKPGVTTAGAGAGLASLCNVVLPGYGISPVVDNVTSAADIPALPSSEPNGLPEATVCDIGYYSLAGRCAQCPAQTVTRVKGAKSVEECSECRCCCSFVFVAKSWLHCNAFVMLHCNGVTSPQAAFMP